jgi:transposase InsO family protein
MRQTAAFRTPRKRKLSAHGSRYASEQFQRLMADSGFCSMSRSGNVWDNAAIEGLFSLPEAERLARHVFIFFNLSTNAFRKAHHV